MLNQLSKLLNPSVSQSIAISGLKKLNPAMDNFVVEALGAGYTADALISFLREKFESQNTQKTRRKSALLGTGQLRPEEEESIQKLRSREALESGIGMAANVASNFVPGGKILNAASSLLENEQPERLETQPNLQPSDVGLSAKDIAADFFGPKMQPERLETQPNLQLSKPLTRTDVIQSVLDVFQRTGIHPNIKKAVDGGLSAKDIAADLLGPKIPPEDAAEYANIEKVLGIPLQSVIEQVYFRDRVKPEQDEDPSFVGNLLKGNLGGAQRGSEAPRFTDEVERSTDLLAKALKKRRR